jgi:hypothetical protein
VTTGPGIGTRIGWLLRGSDWRRWHVHRCLEWGRTFADTEPGSWTDNRNHKFPELCSPYSCKVRRDGGQNHGVAAGRRGRSALSARPGSSAS